MMIGGARAGSLAALALSLTHCGGCGPEANRGSIGDAAPSSAVVPPASASAATTASTRPSSAVSAGQSRPPQLACRAIAVDGDVHLEPPVISGAAVDAGFTAVLLEGLVPTEGWVALARAARLVAKDPRTGRETTLRGPARARACVGFAEETWVASGTFESAVGAGETPGAEEWVVTPLGVLRYSAARLSVDVRDLASRGGEARVSVPGGGALLWPADDARLLVAKGPDAGASNTKTDDGWIRAEGALTLSGSAAGVDGARAAVGRCSALAQQAHDLSAILLAGGADAGTIITQVSTRRLARAACAVAGLRLHALPASSPESVTSELARTFAAASAAWSTLPAAPAPAGPTPSPPPPSPPASQP